jgi:hypothetical protein
MTMPKTKTNRKTETNTRTGMKSRTKAKTDTKTKSNTKTGTKTRTKAKTDTTARMKTNTKMETRTDAPLKTVEKAPVKAIREVEKEIVAKFPEMKGVRPNVVRRKVPAEADLLELIERIDGELGAKLVGAKGKATMQEIYCASFEKEMKTERGTVLRRIVRVTFDREGHILKLVSSK